MTALLIILLIAFVLLIMGIYTGNYLFGDQHLDRSKLIFAALAGSLFITGLANVWLKYVYEADEAFAQEWLANPEGHIEVSEFNVILAIEKTVKDLKGQEHTYSVRRAISTNNAQLLGIVEGTATPLPNYQGYFFLAAGIITFGIALRPWPSILAANR